MLPPPAVLVPGECEETSPIVLLGPVSFLELPSRAMGLERNGFVSGPGRGTNRDAESAGETVVSASRGGLSLLSRCETCAGTATSLEPLLQLLSQDDGVSHSLTRFTKPWGNYNFNNNGRVQVALVT